MKKELKWKIILTIVTLFISMNSAKAEIIIGKNTENICRTYYVRKVTASGGMPGSYSTSITGRGINFYSAFKTIADTQAPSASNAVGQTFCMDLPLGGPYSGVKYNCDFAIEPEKNRGYDVAVTYAYQKLLEKRILSGGTRTTENSRAFGTTLFRWIAHHYGKIGVNSSNADYGNPNAWWRDSANMRTIKAIYRDAVQLGDKVRSGEITYQKLVNKGTIWSDRWEVTTKSTTEDTKAHTAQVVFEIKALSNINTRNIHWSNFKVDCSEYNLSCSIPTNGIEVAKNKKSATFTVNVSGITAKKKKQFQKDGVQFGIKVKTAFVDARSATAHIASLTPAAGRGTWQDMLLIKNHTPSLEIHTEIWPSAESCQCEQDTNGDYTGYYVYTQTKNGETKTDRFVFTDPKAKTYSCPPSDTCKNEETRPHVCETPEESGDGNYYCKETTYGLGGEKCDEEQYNEECKCPQLKEDCEHDPNSPSCQEFDEKCTNCTPSVNLPSSCSNFDDNRIEGEKTVTVGDINETESECNKKANQVKKCVIDKQDLTGTSFEATSEISGNPYCKVWCKENYTFTLPTARYSKSGGYFTLASNVTGTRDCYVSGTSDPSKPIDKDKFYNDLSAAQLVALGKWNEYSKWKAAETAATTEEKDYSWSYTSLSYDATKEEIVSEAKSASGKGTKQSFSAQRVSAERELNTAIGNVETIKNNFNNCFTGWTNNMNFDPIIEFTYNEDYINQMEGKLSKAGNETTSEKNVYCVGDTDDQYNCKGDAYSTSESVPTDKISTIQCDLNGCSKVNFNMSRAKWIQKSKVKTATYQPSNKFSTYTQYGTIKIKDERCDGNDCLWTRLPDNALPVQLRQKSGVFPFEFTFKNVGQSNANASQLGRLIGNETSVLTSYNQLNEAFKCGLKTDKVSATGGYVCYYLNNCDDCDFSCEGDNCEFDDPTPECEGDTCELTCDNCIFDGETATYKYRTVSLNNLFPNACDGTNTNCREEGYNWNSSTKAQVTKKEVEEAGETVYSDAEYSYTLTPTQLQEIRKYNKEVGTYSNSTTVSGENALKCDHETYNGIEYSVRCTSTFLDTANNLYFTENKRNKDFTLWTDTEYCSGGTCLSRQDGIGPSWK